MEPTYRTTAVIFYTDARHLRCALDSRATRVQTHSLLYHPFHTQLASSRNGRSKLLFLQQAQTNEDRSELKPRIQ